MPLNTELTYQFHPEPNAADHIIEAVFGGAKQTHKLAMQCPNCDQLVTLGKVVEVSRDRDEPAGTIKVESTDHQRAHAEYHGRAECKP